MKLLDVLQKYCKKDKHIMTQVITCVIVSLDVVMVGSE